MVSEVSLQGLNLATVELLLEGNDNRDLDFSMNGSHHALVTCIFK